MNSGLFTSKKDDWGTPQELFDCLNEDYQFDVDVCANAENAKVNEYWDVKDDALKQKWNDGRTYWMNPPYGRGIGQWIKKAYDAGECGSTVVCLLPARTDTSWFHDYCMQADTVLFIRGRLCFTGGPSGRDKPAPFPSCIVIFKSD